MKQRTAKQTYLRFPPDLLERIDAFRRKQPIRSSMTDTIQALIERGLDEMERGTKDDG
jgi:predicted DNA-binding protein